MGASARPGEGGGLILRGFGGVELRPGTPAYDAAWTAAQVERAPDAWQGRLRAVHAQRMGDGRSASAVYAANSWLRQVAEPFAGELLPLHATDDDIRAAADRLADECRRTVAGLAKDEAGAYDIAERFCTARGIGPALPVVTLAGVNVRPALARMACARWWRRRLRAHHGRTVEAHAWRLGLVHGKTARRGAQAGERYVSDSNAERRAQQRERNRRALANVEAVNQNGECYSLLELAELSVANPTIRRGELMTRIAGFEECARELGHAAEFWTATAPSEFHTQGGDNPKFSGATARDAQQWLCKSWARFRAWAGRKGVRLYGFRIAEPHQDGCPHWHMLLFMPAAFVARARARFRRYWLRLDQAPAAVERLRGHDRRVALRAAENADESRRAYACKFVKVEMDGAYSAAGYIAKYISKNIDGYQVQRDLYGHDAVQGAARIDAWAATWGIRQFQQIGGAPVGVWRELRRMHADDECTPVISAARACADVSGGQASQGWADYQALQGGPLVRRADLRVTVARTDDGQAWDAVQRLQVEAPETMYGETARGVVWGVRDCARGVSVATRLFAWEVRRRNGTGTGTGAQRVSARAAQPAAQPWTRVNNCTHQVPEVSGPALKAECDPGLQWLKGDDLEAWKRRRDVSDVWRAWWSSGDGAAMLAR